MDLDRAESWGIAWGRHIAESTGSWPELQSARDEFIRRTGGACEKRAFDAFFRASLVRAASELAGATAIYRLAKGKGEREDAARIVREALSEARSETNPIARTEATRSALRSAIRNGLPSLARTAAEQLAAYTAEGFAGTPERTS